MFPFSLLRNRTFQASYACYPVSKQKGNERQDVEKGGKIIMPPSALDMLSRLNVEYPMLFKLFNKEKKRSTHAGVLEFIAEEGKCYLPHWMMKNLLLEEGNMMKISNVALPIATFSKFQPLTNDIFDITNPKAVLENALRHFACLTVGDVISIQYNRKVYELRVLETRPENAVSIIECDMNVEFECPVGYKRPSESKQDEEPMERDSVNEEFMETFVGEGMRLDGKKKKPTQMDMPNAKRILTRGVPDYEHKFGILRFDRSIKPISDRIPTVAAGEGNLETSGFPEPGYSMQKTKN